MSRQKYIGLLLKMNRSEIAHVAMNEVLNELKQFLKKSGM